MVWFAASARKSIGRAFPSRPHSLWEDPMIRLLRSLFAAGLLLFALVPISPARADDGCNNNSDACCGGCGGGHNGMLSRLCQRYQPSVTFYAPVPYWFPNYFGPAYTSYQLVQYHTPP